MKEGLYIRRVWYWRREGYHPRYNCTLPLLPPPLGALRV